MENFENAVKKKKKSHLLNHKLLNWKVKYSRGTRQFIFGPKWHRECFMKEVLSYLGFEMVIFT